MNKPDVLQTISLYRTKFEEISISKVNYPHEELLPETNFHKPAIEHCHGMLDRMEEFVAEDKMEKTFRWLGFIQGVLWVLRIYRLTDLRDHNRSTP